MTDKQERKANMLKNSLIIGAHPDDELLWFNAILKDVDQVAIIFKDFWAHPDLGANRAKAVAAFPRDNVTLIGLEEAGAIGCANWADPVPGPYGLELGREANLRELKRQVKRTVSAISPLKLPIADQSVAAAYRANYGKIRDALAPMLKPDMNVFSHNPWGEYGHEDHVQVYRVLDDLRAEIGFKLWMSNYCTERALPLAAKYFRNVSAPYIRLQSDKVFADRVADTYRAANCWTWADDWAWFDEECYMEAPRADQFDRRTAHRHLLPLNFFNIESDNSTTAKSA